MSERNQLKQFHKKHFDIFSRGLSYLVIEAEDSPRKWEYFRHYTKSYSLLMEACKSPIEKILAAGVLGIGLRYTALQYVEDIELAKNSSCSAVLLAQYPILKYKVDFLVRLHAKGKLIDVIIECDGHDYHERTREQASKDKKRDRELLKLGYLVLRYTGSDIYSRTNECISEISDFLSEKMASLMEPNNSNEAWYL